MGKVIEFTKPEHKHSLSFCPLCKAELIEDIACSNPECGYIALIDMHGCEGTNDVKDVESTS